MTEVSRSGDGYKDKGEPIGTTPDRLAGTAADCVTSGKVCFFHLSVDNLCVDGSVNWHLCLMLPFSLHWICV